MTVSVIIPSYNHGKYLKQRIDSVLNQTFRDFELIILDDASTDNSREIILEYKKRNPGIITCFNDQNSGSPFKQWNKGVSLAVGEYIWIAESDDFADPDFLQKTFTEILKSDETGLVYSNTWILNEQRRIKYLFSDKKSENIDKIFTFKSFIRNPIPNVSSVLFRKSVYLKAGGADETMNFCGDWLLYMKIRQISVIIFLPESLSTFRLHEQSLYHLHYRSNAYLKENVRIYKYLLEESGFSPMLLLQIIKYIIIIYCLRIVHFLKFPSFLIPAMPRTATQVEYI